MPVPPAPPPPNDPYRLEPFECKRCGRCCEGEGYVNVSDEECQRIADFLHIPVEEFLENYTRQEAGYERWLIDGPGETQPCVFLTRDENGLAACRIEGDAKPEQCRTFPMKWRRRDAPSWCAALIEARRALQEIQRPKPEDSP